MCLTFWGQFKEGAFYICKKKKDGSIVHDRRPNLDDLYEGLYNIVRDIYPLAPEVNYNLIDGMYVMGPLK
ncbi:MAG TPA: hypothetical protein PK584_09010, partial [Fervidobacterium sp.]|nr:hypothetical protein [Fervidobacterium sp.]